MRNQFSRPGEPAGGRAQNINTIDEVPDSNWFTNRILARPISPEEAAQGSTTGKGPAGGTWTVTQTKKEGDAPGFTVRDSAGETWFLQFDPKSNPEGATAAAVIANRIFWTLGYFQAEYYLSEFRPEQLQISPEATFTPPSGRKRPLKLMDLQPVLNRAARRPDGSYRVFASRQLDARSVISADANMSWFQSEADPTGAVLGYSAAVSYRRNLIRGLSGTAAVGLDGISRENLPDFLSASALLGLRYSFN
jgi:hypothetical protein